MTKLTCHDAYIDAQQRRTQYPLKSGMYKLEEANHLLKRIVATLERRGRALCPPVASTPTPLPLCVDHEFRSWTRSVLSLIADEQGYNVVAGLAALTGDGFSPREVEKLRADTQPRLNDLIEACDALRRSLPRGYVTNRAVDAMRDLAQRSQDLIATILVLKPGTPLPTPAAKSAVP